MTETIESALGKWAQAAVPDWSKERRLAVQARLGWRSVPIPTLQETGDALGISRQSASEAEKLLIGRLRSTELLSSNPISEALALVDARSPARVDRLRTELAKAGLSVGQVTVGGLIRAADLAGVDHDLSLTGDYVHRSHEPPPPVETTLGHIGKVCRAAGVCSLTALLAEIEWAVRWDPGDLSQDLRGSGVAELLTFPWVAPVGGSTRNALVNLVRQMLSVTESIGIDDIGVAVRRRVRAGRMPFVPPTRVIAIYLSRHPVFDVAEGKVSSQVQLKPEAELGPTDLFLYERLSNDPRGYCTRAGLTSSAEAQGISTHAVAFGLSCSPIIKHVGRDKWTVVGSESSVEASRLEQTATAATHEWDSSGHLVLTAVAISPLVDRLPVPRAVRSYLPPGTYRYDPEVSGSTLIVNGEYVAGIGAALSSPRVGIGETVKVVFDIANRSCAVDIVDKEPR